MVITKRELLKIAESIDETIYYINSDTYFDILDDDLDLEIDEFSISGIIDKRDDESLYSLVDKYEGIFNGYNAREHENIEEIDNGYLCIRLNMKYIGDK